MRQVEGVPETRVQDDGRSKGNRPNDVEPAESGGEEPQPSVRRDAPVGTREGAQPRA